MLRLAETRDASAIAAIFAPYAEASGISFAARAPTPAEWEKKIGKILPQFPFLVFEAGSVVTAYAYASPPERSRLTAGAARFRFHNAYAGIMLPNLASAALHEKFGFRHFATFERIGWKLGRWRDVGWWELKLQPEDRGKMRRLSLALLRRCRKRSGRVSPLYSGAKGGLMAKITTKALSPRLWRDVEALFGK